MIPERAGAGPLAVPPGRAAESDFPGRVPGVRADDFHQPRRPLAGGHEGCSRDFTGTAPRATRS